MKQVPVQALIEERFEEMSPQLQRAAKYILSSPAEVAMYPMREVAKNAAVSPAALTRLAMHLGYRSFNELRAEFREDIAGGMGPKRYAENARSLVMSTKQDIVDDHLATLVRNVLQSSGGQFTAAFIDQLKAAADLLDDCERLYIIGVRNNHAVAFFFSYVTALLRPNVVLVEGRYGMLMDELADIGPNDAALVISFEPYARDAVRCAEIAAERGAKVVALTDSTLAPIARHAREVLVSTTIGVGFYQSSIPALAILEALSFIIATKRGAAGVSRVSSRFDALADEGIYWSGPARRRKG